MMIEISVTSHHTQIFKFSGTIRATNKGNGQIGLPVLVRPKKKKRQSHIVCVSFFVGRKLNNKNLMV